LSPNVCFVQSGHSAQSDAAARARRSLALASIC
jgi:hypothetical protein